MQGPGTKDQNQGPNTNVSCSGILKTTIVTRTRDPAGTSASDNWRLDLDCMGWAGRMRWMAVGTAVCVDGMDGEQRRYTTAVCLVDWMGWVGLDGWMGWAGGCHRKCGTACRAVDTANHTFSHSRKQAPSLNSSMAQAAIVGSFALASASLKPRAMKAQ